VIQVPGKEQFMQAAAGGCKVRRMSGDISRQS
jgi:hypothetical protein